MDTAYYSVCAMGSRNEKRNMERVKLTGASGLAGECKLALIGNMGSSRSLLLFLRSRGMAAPYNNFRIVRIEG